MAYFWYIRSTGIIFQFPLYPLRLRISYMVCIFLMCLCIWANGSLHYMKRFDDNCFDLAGFCKLLVATVGSFCSIHRVTNKFLVCFLYGSYVHHVFNLFHHILSFYEVGKQSIFCKKFTSQSDTP